ncbi:hypothetical protein [Massilia sp. Root351]|uniref:hypothetical protein n=1 Tax=Massilia sp. Root351 TaxID=1736522 RepID=UPI0012F67B47|nr:hypothetical protein [Massilia sp. Root351]
MNQGGAILFHAVRAAIVRSNQFLTVSQEKLHHLLRATKQRFEQQLQENLLAVLCEPGEELTRHLRGTLLEMIDMPARHGGQHA